MCSTGQHGPGHFSRTTSSTTNSQRQHGAAICHVHVSAYSYSSLLCVYLQSVSSPLQLAGFLRLALLSVLFICILLVLSHCKHFCHFKHFVLVSSFLELYCSFQFNFLIFYLFSCLGFYFVVPSLFILSFLSLLQFAIYFVLA